MKWEYEYRRYEYELNKDSLVFDVGGYKGEFAKNIVEKFGCNIHLFEPITAFIDKIPIYPKVKYVNAGLSDRTRLANINVHADGTSLYGMVGLVNEIQLYALRDYMYAEQIDHVDLIKINIEGDEFPLLLHMIDTGIVGLFDNIQVQFHQVIPDAVKLREAITVLLGNTHTREWCYEWIWESWKIK